MNRASYRLHFQSRIKTIESEQPIPLPFKLSVLNHFALLIDSLGILLLHTLLKNSDDLKIKQANPLIVINQLDTECSIIKYNLLRNAVARVQSKF